MTRAAEPDGGAAAAALAAARHLLAALDDPRIADFASALPAHPPARAVPATQIPAVRHLPACARLAPPLTRDLVRALADRAPRLPWGRSYRAGELSAAFLDNYGWCELLGTRGPFASDTLALGVLLLGPDLTYPAHRHVAEEIYVPLLDGALWQAGGAPWTERAAGAAIHHPSNVAHAIATDARPLLALYLWRGGDLAERSRFDAPGG